MITTLNLKNMLNNLGFKNENESFKKDFPDVNAVMSVSFVDNKLYFPKEIKGRERNDGFDKPENFVVFECVNRLLEKGYRPENIELEKEWHLGHDVKGGRADICITDKDDKTLFIIECKTWGREYDKPVQGRALL